MWRYKKVKRPAASYSRTGGSRTTLGDGALDCRVRNGNGYDSPSVATGPKGRKFLELGRTTTRRDAIRIPSGEVLK